MRRFSASLMIAKLLIVVVTLAAASCSSKPSLPAPGLYGAPTPPEPKEKFVYTPPSSNAAAPDAAPAHAGDVEREAYQAQPVRVSLPEHN